MHAVLTDETRALIGEKALRAMKPSAILINTARGELVDEEAVARAVSERWIAGAAIDAFAQEPLPNPHPYRDVDAERLILTPHNIGHSEAGPPGQPRAGPRADPGGGARRAARPRDQSRSDPGLEGMKR